MVSSALAAAFATAIAPWNGEVTAVSEIPEGLRVDYSLRPTPVSLVLCQAVLPPPEKWTGRLWGQGNGGSAGGKANVMPALARLGDAAAHTNMGTGDDRAYGEPEVWEDFSHRATHLMTLSAKALCETRYGRPVERAYFYGCSTGGCQGLMEAQRHPEDYDGVLAIVPAFARLAYHAKYVWNMRQILRPDGSRALTDEQLRTVDEAVLEWFADKDEPWAAGRFPTAWLPTEEDTAGILALAARRDPSLADPDAQARLRALWNGATVCGRRATLGLPYGASVAFWLSGTYANKESWLWNWLSGKHRPLASVTDEELLAWAEGPGRTFNATSPDLSAFFARGGVILMTGGTEDDICTPGEMAAWFEAVAARLGGVEEARKHVRLYINPGRRHGNAHRGLCDMEDMWSALVDWREKGVAPEVMQGVYDWSEAGFPDRRYGGPSRDPRRLPMAPYPDRMTGSDETGWRRVPGPRADPLPLDSPFYAPFSAR